MIGLGIAFLVALALMATGGSAAAKSDGAPPAPPPDLPPVVPGAPDASKPTATTKGASGTTWITQPAGTGSGMTYVDVFLPDGQLGSHPTFRVLRYSQPQVQGGENRRAFMESAAGVDPKVVTLAMQDFHLTSAAKGPIDVNLMPPDLQKKLADALTALTVGMDGKIVGPVPAAAIQLASALAGELDRAGWGAAATALRAYIKAATTLVPAPPKEKQIPLPSTMPADLQLKVNQALQLERDPAKLTLILNALKAYKPQTPDLVNAIGLLQALIVQVKAQQSSDAALNQVQKIVDAPTTTPPAPPAPSGPVARMYQVTKADSLGPSGLAREYTGVDARWTELKPLNTQYDLTKKWYAGMVLHLPPSWPATKGYPLHPGGAVAPSPTPSMPSSPAMPSTPATPAMTYTVTKADSLGPTGLAREFTGVDARWKELRPLNTHYDLTKQWYAGMVLHLPPSWPTTKGYPLHPGGAVATAPAAPTHALPEQPVIVPAVPIPAAAPSPKSQVEIAADALVRNLKAVQGTFGMPGAHGKEDQMIAKRFQSAAGLTADGMTGPGTLVQAAVHGQSDLPLVMYWAKKSSAQDVLKYRASLLDIASRARAAGDLSGAAQLEASAAREHGEGKISTGQLVP